MSSLYWFFLYFTPKNEEIQLSETYLDMIMYTSWLTSSSVLAFVSTTMVLFFAKNQSHFIGKRLSS